ncbi:MAG: FHA domain-containing protein [Fuerstiella sp.]|nr:FHA domain-containing protein [Fuerstiella sp.]MCP4858569.1 FHA domain-containing protein [Fuerstiella sp.]
MINAELHVIGGKHAGQVIPLNRQKFLIGREQDCQLRPNSELVSRHHCVFTVDDFSVRIRDLGSTNGTLVNDERIQKEVVLQPDDRVLVGSLEFFVRINETAEDDTTGEISAKSEETLVGAGTETVTEMTPLSMPIGSDTTFLQAIPTEPAPNAENSAQAAADPAAPLMPQVPDVGAGDTTVMGQPGQIPGQPYPPTPQAGYPMYGAYPYQPMPGQVPGQVPQMYPQGFPGQVPPAPYPYPEQMPQQMGAPADETTAAVPTMPSVTLPDPSETGAKDAPPKPKPADGEAAEEDTNTGADAIIKQYMQRRPGG